MRRVVIAFALALAFASWRTAEACAGCSNPNLPASRSSDVVPPPLGVQTSLTLSGTWMHLRHTQACPEIGPVCEVAPQQPYKHDQDIFSTDLVLDAEVGLVQHLSFEVIAGLRQVTSRARFLDLNNQPYTPPTPDFHHRNETLVGPTDPWLMLHGGVKWNEWLFSGKAGVTAPLGFTVENPFVLGRQGLPHQHFQFGTGTWDPVFGGSVSRQFERFAVTAWTLDRVVVATNSHRFQSGNRLLAGVLGSTRFGLPKWTFSGGVDVFVETAERWDGVLEEEGNLGRTDVLLDLSASWAFIERWSLVLAARIPVWTKLAGEQAFYPAVLNVGVASSFGAF